MNKSVLITGATGFIGQHVLQELCNSGYKDIYAISHNSPIPNIHYDVKKSVIHWNEIELNDEQLVHDFIWSASPDYLIHVAWSVPPQSYLDSPSNLQWVRSSLSLAEDFVNSGGERMIFVSSCFDTYSSSLYGTSKKCVKDLLEKLFTNNNSSFASARVYYLYGPHENKNRVVPYVINSLLNETPINCSSGTQVRDFLHVQDVANGIVSVLNSDVEGTVDICSGKGIAVRDLIEYIAFLMEGNVNINYGAIPTSVDDPPIIIGDSSKLKSLGWYQGFNLESGLLKTIDWWRNQFKE